MSEIYDVDPTKVTQTTVGNDNIVIKIERLYVKEIHCKLPHAPNLFETPEFKESMAGKLSHTIELDLKTQSLADHKYEVVLYAMVQGKAKNLSTFVLEVQQAAIFVIEAPRAQLEQIVQSHCMAILYPYLTQAISNAVLHAGLPPVMLQPLQLVNQAATKISNDQSNTPGSNV